MTREEYEQKSLTFWQHYQHACEKHPFFARGIADVTDSYYQNRKDSALNRRAIYWSKQAQLGKIIRDEKPNAKNVLLAELYELFAAATEGDLKQAHYEIADAIAVLIRLDEQLELLYNAEMRDLEDSEK
ncbi:MAG: hypothetical protein IKR81_11420 [Victivallales bacterium]|nr:hypothetical protein [Victivallales bacterium]